MKLEEAITGFSHPRRKPLLPIRWKDAPGHGKTTDQIAAAINRNAWHVRKDGKPYLKKHEKLWEMVIHRWFHIGVSRLNVLPKKKKPAWSM